MLLQKLALALAAFPIIAHAQPGLTDPAAAVITGPSEVAVGRTIVLDASASRGISEDAEYRWYRDEIPYPISRSVEMVYTPEKSGVSIMRLVITESIDGQLQSYETERLITVYERKIVLAADSTVSNEKLLLHAEAASQAGVYLRILQPEESSIPLGTEESLAKAMEEESTLLSGTENIILWADGITGLKALMRATENDPQKLEALQAQTIILISTRGLHALARTVGGPFAVLKPERILLTRPEAIHSLVATDNYESLSEQLRQRDIDYHVIDASSVVIRPWNILSSLVNYMLTHGVSSQTVILLLMLPVIATLLAFLKQVIGVTTFGLYAPSIVSLSFMALGWKIGIGFLVFIIITGYATRQFMRRWRLLYIPKVAIILTVVSLTLLVLLGLGAYYGITLSGDTIFVLLIMSTLAESFLNVKTEEGLKSAIFGIAETILAALLCVFIVQWSFLQSLVLAYPELILLTVLINIFLGRWTGLRLVEYFRFREVFKHLQEE